MKKFLTLLVIILVNLATFESAHAGLSLSATRIIFNGKDKQTSIRVNNSSNTEGFFQVWLDLDNDEKAEIPFAVVPPFAKISANGSQELRIIAQGKNLPQDRESIYWFNVQEIPRVSSEYAEGKASGVSFTIRQRIKFFYRPETVKTDASAATALLEFKPSASSKQEIIIKNPSANFVTLVNFKTSLNEKDEGIASVIMVPPLSEVSLATSKPTASNATLYFDTITDFGFPMAFSVTLSPDKFIAPTVRTIEQQ